MKTHKLVRIELANGAILDAWVPITSKDADEATTERDIAATTTDSDLRDRAELRTLTP